MSLPKDGGLDTTPPAVAASTPSQEPCPAGPDVPREGSREIQKRGKIISVPHDWCRSKQKPVPYKIWCWQADAGNLANTVRQTDCRSHVQGSYVKVCYGDEPGQGGGVKSGTYQAECTLIGGSPTVRAEGRPMGRRFDKWEMNHGNTWGCLENPEDTGNYNAPKVQLIKPQLNPPDATREDDIQASAQGMKVAQLASPGIPFRSPFGAPLPGPDQFQQMQNVGKALGQGYKEQFGPGTMPLWQRPAANIDRLKDYLFNKSHESSPPGVRVTPKQNTTTKDPCDGFRKQLAAHIQKLADYTANPQGADNLGILGHSPGRDASIIAGRKAHLETEIRASKSNLRIARKTMQHPKITSVQIESIREAVNLILNHIENDLGLHSIEIPASKQYYWDMGIDAKFSVEDVPPDLTIGKIGDDLEFISLMLQGAQGDSVQAPSLMLMHVGPVLLMLGNIIKK